MYYKEYIKIVLTELSNECKQECINNWKHFIDTGIISNNCLLKELAKPIPKQYGVSIVNGMKNIVTEIEKSIGENK